MGQVSVWFDEDGDYLEVTVADKRGHFRDLGDGIFERIDEDGTTLGVAIRDVSARTDHELPFDADVHAGVS